MYVIKHIDFAWEMAEKGRFNHIVSVNWVLFKGLKVVCTGGNFAALWDLTPVLF